MVGEAVRDGVSVIVGVEVSVNVAVKEGVKVEVGSGVSVQTEAVEVRTSAVCVACCSGEGAQADKKNMLSKINR